MSIPLAMVVGVVLGIIVGVVAVRLGVQGFSSRGIPLSRTKTLRGSTAKALGVVCIVIGLAFFGSSGFGMWKLISTWPKKTPSNENQHPPGFNEQDPQKTIEWFSSEVRSIFKSVNPEENNFKERAQLLMQELNGKCLHREIRWVVELDRVTGDRRCTLIKRKWEAPTQAGEEHQFRVVLELQDAERVDFDSKEFVVSEDLWHWVKDRPRGEKLLLTGRTTSVYQETETEHEGERPVRTTSLTLTVSDARLSRIGQ